MNSGRFSNGFLLGLIIGGGLVFLLGTKTGKAILKTVSEEGLEGLTGFLEDLDLEDLEEDIPDEVEEAKEVSGEKNPEIIEEIKETPAEKAEMEEKPVPKPKKRFFRKKS
jgi:hypothetical protein